MALYPRIPLSTLINYDNTVLDGIYYPAGGRDDFLSYFQLEYGEFTPIYQRPDLLKEQIRVLGVALQPTIDAWAEALALEYNPIENYDRIETGGDTTAHGKIDTTTHGKAETITGGHKDTQPLHSEEHLISADNSSTYYPSDKTVQDQSEIERTYNSEKTTESGTTKNQESGKTTITHNWRIHGNIGTMTTQDMLGQELNIRRFCYMEEVGRLYAEKFLIMLY